MGMTRRSLIAVSGVSAAALLAGCGSNGSSSSGKGGDISYGFYGNSQLEKARLGAVAAFNKTNPGFKVSGLFTPSADYWTKLNTLVSAGTVPDVFATQNPYTTSYYQKNVLADLTQFPDIIHPSLFQKDLLPQGAVDGKQVSLPISINARAIVYDSVTVKSLGVSIPDTWSWDDYKSVSQQIHDASKGQYAGSEDMGPNISGFELYIRGLGLGLYKSASALGFTSSNLGDWFSYWDGLRKAGGAVSAGVTSGYTVSDWPNSPMILKKGLMQYCSSNNIEGIQALIKNQIKLTTPPAPQGTSADYLGSASYAGIFSKSKSQQHAAMFLNWLLTSQGAVKVLGLASGPPADSKLTDSLDTSSFSQIDKTELAYVNKERQASLKPAPTIFPGQAQQIQDLFTRTYQDISFGRSTIPAGVKSFFDQVPSMLSS